MNAQNDTRTFEVLCLTPLHIGDDKDARRIFGHFEDQRFVIDDLNEHFITFHRIECFYFQLNLNL